LIIGLSYIVCEYTCKLCAFIIAADGLADVKISEQDTARVEDMVKEYFNKADDVSMELQPNL